MLPTPPPPALSSLGPAQGHPLWPRHLRSVLQAEEGTALVRQQGQHCGARSMGLEGL